MIYPVGTIFHEHGTAWEIVENHESVVHDESTQSRYILTRWLEKDEHLQLDYSETPWTRERIEDWATRASITIIEPGDGPIEEWGEGIPEEVKERYNQL